MINRSILQNVSIGLMFVCVSAIAAFGQTTAFNYQGKLTDTGVPQSAYQMRFELYDAASGGSQIGAAITNTSVAVAQGIFSLQLDFGAAAFDGTDRFLEIAVRRTSGDAWTTLTTRQQIGSTPHSIKSANATTADSLSTACVGCVQDANITQISGSKVIGEISSQSVPTGSGNYIQNSATALKLGNISPQQAADFNIDGSGVIGDSLGIGIVPRAGIKLDVIGTALISPGGAGAMQFGNPNSETGMTTLVGTGRADLRYDGTTLKLVAGLAGGPPPSTNGIVIDNAGNVGVGTATPQAKLHVAGNTVQDRDKGGMMKAMLYVSSLGTIVRCYNGVSGASTGNCGFAVVRTSDGFYEVDFGFQVSDRFVSLTARDEVLLATFETLNYAASFRFPINSNNVLRVSTFFLGERRVNADASFMLLVY
jgi:hypothetical protein